MTFGISFQNADCVRRDDAAQVQFVPPDFPMVFGNAAGRMATRVSDSKLAAWDYGKMDSIAVFAGKEAHACQMAEEEITDGAIGVVAEAVHDWICESFLRHEGVPMLPDGRGACLDFIEP